MRSIPALILVLFVIGSKAWAFTGDCSMEANAAAMLCLTEDQKAAIASLNESFQKEFCPLHNQLLSKKGELAQLWLQADPDHTQIAAKHQEIQRIQTRLQERATYYHLECRRVLSSEQRKKLAEIRPYYGGGNNGHNGVNAGW